MQTKLGRQKNCEYRFSGVHENALESSDALDILGSKHAYRVTYYDNINMFLKTNVRLIIQDANEHSGEEINEKDVDEEAEVDDEEENESRKIESRDSRLNAAGAEVARVIFNVGRRSN
ncbi:hypothetical protein PGT21_009556 [Puccinia graminis f. sp. tritici]|uniref:Uncharacterized protein n=1 Tax=Puccinia graminis f. sp. tritici TaxID=56615 RepID=A0A5B0NDS2_PUCGR|nr:hypothetical protein PGT21_009556 [Puccinia graminis f. sp. tritici]